MHFPTALRHYAAALSRLALAASAAALALVATPAQASGVRAGTVIANTATATYDGATGPTTISSNTVSLTVDEVLDVAVVARDSNEASVAAGSTGQVRAFTVTNAGNGAEAFVLAGIGTAAGQGFTPTVTGVVVDSNINGIYDAGIDQVLGADGAIPAMEPDATLVVFVLSTVVANAADGSRGTVRLSAVSRTGTGTAGTVFAGQGTGGGDAIVGATRAEALANGTFVVARATVTFAKTATVADPFGGTRAVPGAIITYRLAATIGGSGTLTGLRVTDAIPAGTTYQPGTLTLDGAALSDAADSDSGTVSATGIAVAFPPQTAGAARAVAFNVKID